MSRAATDAPPGATATTKKAATNAALKPIPLRLSLLTRDPGVQPRVSLDEKTVARYAELMKEGATFPALTVFDDGTTRWLADSFLRAAAAERAGLQVFPCEVREGSRRAALLFSIGANARHGLPLSLADRLRVAEMLLRDPVWSQWSDRDIARRTGTSHTTVNKLRRRVGRELGAAAVTGPRLCGLKNRVHRRRPRQKEMAPNYFTDYLYFLVRFDARQFLRWKEIVNLRADRHSVAEAVKIVMEESKQAAPPPERQPAGDTPRVC